jgi:hypothetical protein
MPTLTIYALIAAALFSGGYAAGYKFEHAQVQLCEAKIEQSNDQAKIVLAEKSAQVERLGQAQTINNLSLEAEHAKNIELVNAHSIDLDNARRLWASHQPRCSGSLSKADHPGIDKNDDGEGYYLDAGQLSESIDGLIRKADIDSADHHEVMQWLNSLPLELIK